MAFELLEGYGLELQSKETRRGRFYTVREGVKYPSITTMLSSAPKPGLDAWKQSVGRSYAEKEMVRAAARGTAVHEMMENHINGSPNPTEGHDRLNINLFNQLKRPIKKLTTVYCQEKALYSDVLQLAGRVDCIGVYDGVLSVVDFKTSTNAKTEEMIEDYFLQTTAYALMFEELYDIVIPQVVVLIATENGLPMVFKRNPDDYMEALVVRTTEYHEKRAKEKEWLQSETK